jgi:uncharacterized protein YsxB (DUF464 family)
MAIVCAKLRGLLPIMVLMLEHALVFRYTVACRPINDPFYFTPNTFTVAEITQLQLLISTFILLLSNLKKETNYEGV